MKFQDEGYIINLRKYGESSLILTVLTREHGKLVGFVKHCLNKKNLAVFQLGNLVAVDVYARLDENMPSLRVELISPTAVNFMDSSAKLQTLTAFCGLANACLPELANLENFYDLVSNFFNLIDEDNWLTNYALFEFYLLDFLGIGLDLSCCAVTGQTENLAYVSPKSGKAVSAEAGEIYKDKLFLYPHFVMQNRNNPKPEELRNLLRMTEFFLRKNFFNSHGLKFPESRANLAEIIYNQDF